MEDKHLCPSCGKYELVFSYNDWVRFAFSDEQFAWIYVCEACNHEETVSQSL